MLKYDEMMRGAQKQYLVAVGHSRPTQSFLCVTNRGNLLVLFTTVSHKKSLKAS